jgi:hypothetical protein
VLAVLAVLEIDRIRIDDLLSQLVHFGVAEARGASLVSISQQTTTENANAHAQLKLGFLILSDRGGRIARLFGARWGIPELLRDIHRKSGIDLPLLDRAARVGRCRSRPASSSMGLGSSPTPRSTPASPALPAVRRLASAGPPAQPARRLNREQQSTGVPRRASEPPARRPSAFLQNAPTRALLRRRKQPRPRSGTTAPERRRDD